MTNPEKQMENSIVEYLTVKGHYVQKIQSGVFFAFSYGTDGTKGKKRKITCAPSGTPDLFLCIASLFVAIEVKRDEKVSRHWERTVARYMESGEFAKSNRHIIDQFEIMKRIVSAGGIAICVGSIEELEHKLNFENIII